MPYVTHTNLVDIVMNVSFVLVEPVAMGRHGQDLFGRWAYKPPTILLYTARAGTHYPLHLPLAPLTPTPHLRLPHPKPSLLPILQTFMGGL